MKITHSRYFYYLIILLSLGVITFSVYYQLGGLREFQVSQKKNVSYSIAGTEFRGDPDDPKIKELYDQAKGLVTEGRVSGTLGLIEYRSGVADREVRYFIGVILQDRISELPPEYRVKIIQAESILAVALDVHPLVRPQKGDIEAKIYAFARENGLVVEDYFLEKHFKDDVIVIEGFVK